MQTVSQYWITPVSLSSWLRFVVARTPDWIALNHTEDGRVGYEAVIIMPKRVDNETSSFIWSYSYEGFWSDCHDIQLQMSLCECVGWTLMSMWLYRIFAFR
jgi:hypothetical protein